MGISHCVILKLTKKVLIAPLVCLCLLPVAARTQKSRLEALPVDKFQEMSGIPAAGLPLSLSGDGQWIAYVVRATHKDVRPLDSDDAGITAYGIPEQVVGSDIWIVNTHTRRASNLTNGPGTSWAPLWSPDGRYLAFTSDRDGRPQLWLWDKSSNKVRRASSEWLNPTLFVGRPYHWAADSRHIVAKILPEGTTVEDLMRSAYGSRQRQRSVGGSITSSVMLLESHIASESAQNQADSEGFDNPYELSLSDIAVIDIEEEALRRVVRHVKLVSMSVSPDGGYIALISYSRQLAPHSQQSLFQLSLVSLTSGKVTLEERDVSWDYRPINWSSDSSVAIYSTRSPRNNSELHLLSVRTKELRKFGLPSELWMSDASSTATPWLWDDADQTLCTITKNKLWRVNTSTGTVTKAADISGLTLLSLIPTRENLRVWSPADSHSATVVARNDQTLEAGFYRVNLATGKVIKLLEEAQTYRTGIGLMEVSERQDRLVFLAEGAQQPGDIWIADSNIRGCQRLTNTNPTIDEYELGTTRLIKWKGLDGQNLQGALILPSNYSEDKRCPLIVYVLGGVPLSEGLNTWGGGFVVFNMQLLATRGYAILLPDSPLQVGTPMQDLAKTVLPGVQKLVDLGIADPNRVGVIGHSYGGYSALALIAESTQFKAAVAISGSVNLLNAYAKVGMEGGSVGWVEEGQGRMGGSLWQYRDRFIENSPLFYLDRVEAPVLIIHGDSDRIVSVTESRIAFQSLRRLGKEASLAEYEGEGHRPQLWSYGNRVDLCGRVIAWFDKYLKGDSPKEGSSSPLSRNPR